MSQEAFFAAWLALSRYDPEQPFEAWLRRIALNKCRDRARRNAVRSFLVRARVLDDDSEELPDAPDPAPGPDTLVASREELRQLEAALGNCRAG